MGARSTIEAISDELISLLGTGLQIEPFSRRYSGFDLADAYAVAARIRDLRKGRGENTVGRKIGFTNQSIWGAQGISAPIWNYVFDRTIIKAGGGLPAIDLRAMPEPRIEPEVVLHLAAAPTPGMTANDLLRCLDWVAPAFEVVYSVFPNWDFTPADAAAAYGVHGGLLVGERLHLEKVLGDLALKLSTFSVEMENGQGVRRQGEARNVLGGPLWALKFLVDELERYGPCEPLRPGELVTTGTLTEAMPLHSGETWSARFEGIDLKPLKLHIE